MTPEMLKEYIDVLRYALDALWPYGVALGVLTPLASKNIRNAVAQRTAQTIQPKDK